MLYAETELTLNRKPDSASNEKLTKSPFVTAVSKVAFIVKPVPPKVFAVPEVFKPAPSVRPTTVTLAETVLAGSGFDIEELDPLKSQPAITVCALTPASEKAARLRMVRSVFFMVVIGCEGSFRLALALGMPIGLVAGILAMTEGMTKAKNVTILSRCPVFFQDW